MAKSNLVCGYLWLIIILVYSVELSSAQETSSCYGPGSIAASVILSILFTALLLGAAYYLWLKYKAKKEHLIIEADPEKGKGEYAFDNPGFKDAGFTPITKSTEKNNKLDTSNKTKWNQWSPLSALTMKSEKRKTLDDSAIEENEVKVVALRSHDFTGLGFNICGNMKEGIYIKDVLHRGPASESGKLNPGDRINSVTISFEHMVYEDALTILSYASPYEVIIEAKGGKLIHNTSGQGAQPSHPVYRSSSCTDLFQVEKSAKKRLFGEEYAGSLSSNYSSLQKSRSNMTTLERKESKSPRINQIRTKKVPQLSPEQLKMQLEQKIISDHQHNLRIKNEKPRVEVETQKSENKFQKFGIRVLPLEQQQKSPKSAELSQNDNNLNMEKQLVEEPRSIDEVDTNKKVAPQAKKREKKPAPEKIEENFNRTNSLNDSGIKRDKNGIPQEIPTHMLNAAVAARRNRKTSDDKGICSEEEIDSKTPKKVKAKAPPPPPSEEKKSPQTNKTNYDEIQAMNEDFEPLMTKPHNLKDEVEIIDTEEMQIVDNDTKGYNSDSDVETDNQSSVNTIELNSSDITIHHAEENEERQNRKTASTGDLTKIGSRKNSTGTLERAQSLDITDSGIPSLNKKRKGGRIEDVFDSSEDIFGKVMLNKEPRLSLILDGLNTFQRNRLKKSTEWGNLEDAILKVNQEDENLQNSVENISIQSLPEKSPEFNAVVNKINEIKKESEDNKFERIDIETVPDIMNEETDRPIKTMWQLNTEDDDSTRKIRKFNLLKTVEQDNNKPIVPPKTEEILQKAELRPHAPVAKILSNEMHAVTEKLLVHKRPHVTDDSSEEVVIPEKKERHSITIEKPEPKIEITTNEPLTTKPNDNIETRLSNEDTSPRNFRINEDLVNAVIDQSNITQIENLPDKVSTVTIKEPEISSKEISTTVLNQPEPEEMAAANIKNPVMNSNNTDETKTSVTTQSAKPVFYPNPLEVTQNFIYTEKYSCDQDNYNPIKDDTNISDDIKVSRHSLGSLERPKSDDAKSLQSLRNNVSNITINNTLSENGDSELHSLEVSINEPQPRVNESQINTSELYTTALETPAKESRNDTSKITISTPDLIKNVSITEAINSLNNDITIHGPSSLSFEIPSEKVEITESGFSTITNKPISLNNNNLRNIPIFDLNNASQNTHNNQNDQSNDNSLKNNSTLTYITEIQVTPNNSLKGKNISEIEIIPNSDTRETNGRNLDSDFENYVKNFESNVKNFESNIQDFEVNINNFPKNDVSNIVITENSEAEKELHKIQEIVEEQLKKLPEMRFTTSSYETSKIPEKRQSQIELLRSNFEKSPPKLTKTEVSTKSRIPIATTTKTPPTSPERRDSRNLDMEQDKAILELMSSTVHSTPVTTKYQSKTPTKNVTVTSIRSSSKIPSGLPTLSSGRPPIPPKKYDSNDGDSLVHVSTNGGSESSFKQWVFNPNDSVTNIVVTENKQEHKQ